jgi:serine/threonine protein kinase
MSYKTSSLLLVASEHWIRQMSYCLNPGCPKPQDPDNIHQVNCLHCGSELLLGGRYRVVGVLGSNWFNKTVAVEAGGERKIFKLLRVNEAIAVALFEQEASVLSQLNHRGLARVEPNLLKLSLSFSDLPTYGMAIDKIEGDPLPQWRGTGGDRATDPIAVLDGCKQLIDILGQVHDRQYFHLNLNPSNVLVRSRSENGTGSGLELALIGFGAAREVVGTYITKIGGGTIPPRAISAYIPPEQVEHNATVQSDFFAVGRTMVYWLTGRDPLSFEQDESGHLNWRQGARDVPEGFAALVDRLMAPDRGDRPESHLEIREAIAALERQWKLPPLEIARFYGDLVAEVPSVADPTPAGVTPIEATTSSQSREGGQPNPDEFFGNIQIAQMAEAIAPFAQPEGVFKAEANALPRRRSFRRLGLSAIALAAIAAIGGFGAYGGWAVYNKRAQCQQLLTLATRGRAAIAKPSGSEAAVAEQLAADLDGLAGQLQSLELSDEQLAPLSQQFRQSYLTLSRAFKQIAEAIAAIDNAPLTQSGLQGIRQAKAKAEQAGETAKQAARDADSAATTLASICPQGE